MDDQEIREFLINELNKREKIQEEKMREIARTEIKNTERRKRAKAIIKDPSAYHKLHREIN
jgi:hypothetical protein